METHTHNWLERTELLLGSEKLELLRNAHVLVVGLGGVGAYAAEMIARAGVGRMTVADADTVNATNINRQLVALHSTVGRPKAEVLAERLRDINPGIGLTVVDKYIKDEETYILLDAARYDYVVDAIDTPEQARQALAKGYCLSFGERTFASPKTLAALRGTPLSQLFLETDDSPVPIAEIYARAAEAKGVPEEVLQRTILDNYKRIFTGGEYEGPGRTKGDK